jgi:hypothetical protein
MCRAGWAIGHDWIENLDSGRRSGFGACSTLRVQFRGKFGLARRALLQVGLDSRQLNAGYLIDYQSFEIETAKVHT